MQRTELLCLLRRGSRCQVPGLSVDRVYNKHLFSGRRNNIRSKGGHKTYSLCGLLRERRRQRKKEDKCSRCRNDKKPRRKTGEEGGDGAEGAAALLRCANLTHSSIYKHQLPEKHCCLLSINQNHSPMAHPIMRPHTEPRLCRGSTLFFGGQPDPGLDHPTTLPWRLETVGGHQTLWLRLVCQIHGRIVRSGYQTANMMEQ